MIAWFPNAPSSSPISNGSIEVIDMLQSQTNVVGLTQEYITLVDECRSIEPRTNQAVSRDRLVNALVESSDWTAEAATALVQTADNYGVFMLRNALALAIALNVEDGQLGY